MARCVQSTANRSGACRIGLGLMSLLTLGSLGIVSPTSHASVAANNLPTAPATSPANHQEPELAVHPGATLEQRGYALMRSAPAEFRTLDALIQAIALGEELRDSLTESGGSGSSSDISQYPAVSPLLALRTAVNTVSERTSVPGLFQEFSPDGQYFIASSNWGGVNTLYDLSGNAIKTFSDRFISFTPDGQHIVTNAEDNETTYLYDSTGQQVAQFPGMALPFTNYNDWLITYSGTDDITYANNLVTGEERQFAGYFEGFSETAQRLVVLNRSQEAHQLYDVSGKMIKELPSDSFKGFSDDGQWFVMAAWQEGSNTLNSLYDADGNQVAQFPGYFYGFSPDSQLIVTHSHNDGASRLYDLNGNQVAQFPPGEFATFGKDSQWLAIVTTENEERVTYLYDLQGNQIGEVPGFFVALSEDGQRLVTSESTLEKTYLHDIATNKTISVDGYFYEFSHDGQRLVTYTSTGDVSRLYDLSGNEIAQFLGEFRKGAFGQNDQRIAIYFQGKTHLYDLTANVFSRFKFNNVVFSPAGDRIVAYSGGENIYHPYDLASNQNYLYDLAGNLIAEFPGTFYGFSSDGQRLAASSEENITRLYDVSGNEVAEIPGYFDRFSNNGQQILSFTISEGRLENTYLHDINGNQIKQWTDAFLGFRNEGQLLATTTASSTLITYLFDWSGNEVGQFQGELAALNLENQRFTTRVYDEYATYLYDLSTGQRLEKLAGEWSQFSDDGQWLFIRAQDRDSGQITTTLYTSDGEQVGEFPGESRGLSRNGQYMMTYFHPDGSYYLFDSTGNELSSFQTDSFLSFSPDSQQVMFFDVENDVTAVYDLEGNQLKQIPGRVLEFSQNRQWLVSVSESAGITYLYDLGNQTFWQTQGYFDGFSQDGQRLIVSSEGEDISRIFNLSGELLAEYPGVTTDLGATAVLQETLGFGPNEEYLMTISRDRYSQLFRLDDGLNDLLAQGCHWLTEVANTTSNPQAAEVCQD